MALCKDDFGDRKRGLNLPRTESDSGETRLTAISHTTRSSQGTLRKPRFSVFISSFIIICKYSTFYLLFS